MSSPRACTSTAPSMGEGGSGDHAVAAPSTAPPIQQPPQNPANLQQHIFKPIRKIVSQNRRRYMDNGFNLDLTYITDRIIAMGYPADTKEAVYRNSMSETVEFLEQNHKDHYKVFNLRGQYVYDTSKFKNRVLSFEMQDHHPPRLEMMAPFCREVHEFLSQDPQNVVAVHCKAGKGRTGVMICAYLCYVNFYHQPRQNMDYYSCVRTRNNKGVTIPSQRRYIYYFSHLRNKNLNYIPLRVELIGIFMERPPRGTGVLLKRGIECRVVNGDVVVFQAPPIALSGDEWDREEAEWNGKVGRGDDCYENGGEVLSRRAYGWEVPKEKRVFLEGDVRIDLAFTSANKIVPKTVKMKTKIGHCWVNTMFMCPSFCGGAYIHGDEAYPYPEDGTTISFRKQSSTMRAKSGSASVPSSPPPTPTVSACGGGSSSVWGVQGGGGLVGKRAPSFEARHASNHSLTTHKKQHEKGKERSTTVGGTSRGTNNNYSSAADDDDFMLVRPPGIDEHCPPQSLELIYKPLQREPPRKAIETMLRDAHKKNLISDSYNKRRLSVPQEGNPVAKAPEGRPFASGPNCIVRRPDEHSLTFSVLEIDNACKSKGLLDEGFKMIVVTRCAPESLAVGQTFVNITREKQMEKDRKNKEKIEARARKLASASSGSSCGRDENAEDVCSGSATDDPREKDAYFKRFFFRQRGDSLSKYPHNGYRCPLQKPSTSTDKEQKNERTDETVNNHHDSKTTDSQGHHPHIHPLPPKDTMSYNAIKELDLDVRSYHPDEAENTGTSRSDTSTASGDSQEDSGTPTAAEQSFDVSDVGVASSTHPSITTN